jgi:DNA-binding PadR family transcriptional regulator
MLAVLPDFSDHGFIRRDVEAKIVEVWPEVESKNFTSGIAAVMTDLEKKGLLESTEGESRSEPRVYRLKDNLEVPASSNVKMRS